MWEQRLKPVILWAATWLVIGSPATVYLVELGDFGRLQNNDYYIIVGELVDGESLTRDPARWLALKSNEHRATLPALVYALNMALSDGHNLGLTLFALALLTAVLVMLCRLLPEDVASEPWARAVFGFVLGLFCFTPVAAHNVAMGFSGTQWFSSNACAVAAIGTLTGRAGSGRTSALWPAVLFGWLGAFCYSTSLMIWPALLAGAAYLRLGLRRLLFLAAGATAVAALFVLSYEVLPYNPEPNPWGLRTLLRYSGIYLGGLFTNDLEAARYLGYLGIAGCLASLVLIPFLTRTSEDLRGCFAPWLMIQVYAFVNVVGTAVGRSGFGLPQAMSSRYASVAALFWIGLLTPILIVAWRRRPAAAAGRLAALAALAAAVLAMAVPMHRRGGRLIDRFELRGSRQEVAALAVVYEIHDDELLKQTLAPWPVVVWRVREFLRASGHVPFDRAYPLRLGERVDPGLLRASDRGRVRGFCDRVVELDKGLARFGGWAWSPAAAVAEVLLLDAEGTIRGELVTGVHRPDVARAVHADALTAGWEGYGVLGRDVRAWVRIAGDPGLYPLPTTADAARPLAAGD